MAEALEIKAEEIKKKDRHCIECRIEIPLGDAYHVAGKGFVHIYRCLEIYLNRIRAPEKIEGIYKHVSS